MTWYEKSRIGLEEVTNVDECVVRVYPNRLVIWRIDGERLGWEELQIVKQKIWGDRIAIEVYPACDKVVNLRHTRHLWWTPDLEEMVKCTCNHPEFEK